MATPSCRRLLESILSIGSLLHASLPKTLPPNVDIALNNVMDAAVAVPSNKGPYEFEYYGDSEEDDHQPATDLSQMFQELRLAKPVDIWCNLEPIPPLLLNSLTETL